MSSLSFSRITRISSQLMRFSRLRASTQIHHIHNMHRMRAPVRNLTLCGIAFGTSYLMATQFENGFRGSCSEHDRAHHLQLFNKLRELAPEIDAKTMLKLFLKQFNNDDHNAVSEEFVVDLFTKVGIDDPEVARHLFRIMDWNNNGSLEPAELAATFTLFQVGSELQRYKFLFHCLDLDESRSVDKQEFRAFLTALLEAKYHLSGLNHYKDPDELYIDITIEEYRTIAKIKANALVREIFLFADQNRDGELNMKEFLHWCKRGGRQVAVLKDLLYHVCDEALDRDETAHNH